MLKERDKDIISICGDFTTTEFQDTYSTIICIEALGYFNDLESFFKKTTSLLADDGRLIIHYNNPGSWRFLLRKLKHWRTGHYPYNELIIEEVKRILSACELEIEKISGMNWIPLPLSSNSWLVSVFEYMEKMFQLEKWHSQSPWLLMSIKKQN